MAETVTDGGSIQSSGISTSERSIVLAAKGGGITLVGAIFEYGSWMVIGILLTRFLGAEQYGLYALTLSSITIATGLASLGLAPALVRYVSVFVGRGDTAKTWGTLQVGLGLTAIASLVVGIGLFALAVPIAKGLSDEPKLVPLLRLGSVMIPFMALSSVLAAATQGFKTMQYAVIAQKISQPLIRLVLVVVLALVLGLNAANALGAHFVAVATVFAMLLHFLNRLFPLRRPLRVGRRSPAQVLSFSLPIYFTRLINTFRRNIQTLALGAFQAVTTVGLFAVAGKVDLVGRMFHHSIITASAPIVSDLYDQGNRAQLARFYQTVTKWTFTANLPLFLILQSFPSALLSIFGQEYVGGAVALTTLAWGNLVEAGTGICGVVIEMTGRTRLKLVNALAALGVLLGLNLLLIPRWGLIGAAAASATANAAINLLRLAEVYLLYGLLPYNVGFLKPLMAGLIALMLSRTMRRWLPSEETLVFIALKIVLLLAAYAAAIVLLGLDQEDRAVLSYLGRRLRARFQRRED